MRILFVLIGIMTINNMISQDLKKHQWENRVVLILSQNEDSQEYQNQMAEFNKLNKELKERKMVIYQVLPQQYRMMDYPIKSQSNDWISSPALFDEFANKKNSFKVILIGLDGGIKLQKYEVLKATELFGTIDSMPMRQSELNKKKNR